MCLSTNQWRIQDFPEEGGANPKGRGGRQPIIWPIFPKNCMKMKKFWARGGGASLAPPLDPPLRMWVKLTIYLCVSFIKRKANPTCFGNKSLFLWSRHLPQIFRAKFPCFWWFLTKHIFKAYMFTYIVMAIASRTCWYIGYIYHKHFLHEV